MLIKKLFRTMRQYKAQFISMIIMIALGIGIFVGFNMEWVSIDKNTSAYFKKTGFADYRITSEKGFSTDELSSILDIDGVVLTKLDGDTRGGAAHEGARFGRDCIGDNDIDGGISAHADLIRAHGCTPSSFA